MPCLGTPNRKCFLRCLPVRRRKLSGIDAFLCPETRQCRKFSNMSLSKSVNSTNGTSALRCVRFHSYRHLFITTLIDVGSISAIVGLFQVIPSQDMRVNQLRTLWSRRKKQFLSLLAFPPTFRVCLLFRDI